MPPKNPFDAIDPRGVVQTDNPFDALDSRSVVGNPIASPDASAPPNPQAFANIPPSMISGAGAPLTVRATVGSVGDAGDRLATLRKFYPDAQPYGTNNFIYTDPETKVPTLYKSSHPGLGDVASMGREIAQMFGGAAAAAVPAIGGVALAPETAGVSLLGGIPAARVAYGLGSQGAGELYDRTLDFLGNRVDTRGPMERLTDPAAGFTLDQLGLKYVPPAVQAVSKAVAGATNRFVGTGMDQLYRAFQSIGARPTAGQIAGGPIAAFESGLKEAPTAAGVIGGARADAVDAVKQYANQTINDIGTAQTNQQLGGTIRNGVAGALDRINAATTAARKNVTDLLQGASGIPAQTLNYIKSLTDSASSTELPNTMEGLANKPLQTHINNFLSDVVGPDGTPKSLSYEAIDKFHKGIGKIIGDPSIAPDIDRGALQQLYKASVADLGDIAGGVSPEALAAHNSFAENYAKTLQDNIIPMRSMLHNSTDAEIGNSVMQGSRLGDDTLAMLRRNLVYTDPVTGKVNMNGWNNVTASVLNRMGLADQGYDTTLSRDFSPTTFINNWKNLSPEAKTTLFYGGEYGGMREPLDRLVTLSKAVKGSVEGTNWSHTAGALAGLGLVTGGVGAATTGDWKGFGTGVVAPFAVAKLLTSPSFVGWLAKAAKPGLTYPGFTGQLGGLAAIAEGEPHLKDAIAQYMATMSRAANWNAPPQK
jgi:hypothetical protein